MDKQKELDQFYTNIREVPRLYNLLCKKIETTKINADKIVWLEPSAGTGSFLNELSKFYSAKELNYRAFDLQPKNNKFNIKERDFLKITKKDLKCKPEDEIITFGNPPFGKKGNLAIEFINKSFEFSDVVAFILPNIFVRYLTQKKIDENLKLVHQSEMPFDSFIANDKPYNVNCVFQIWVNSNREDFKKLKDLRKKTPPIKTHEDFELRIHNNTKETLKYFDKKNFDWDFAIHRQGYYDYEVIFTEENQLIQNRQYLFIKFNKRKNKYKKVIKEMNLTKMTKWSTSTPGFSNEDFVREYVSTKRRMKWN